MPPKKPATNTEPTTDIEQELYLYYCAGGHTRAQMAEGALVKAGFKFENNRPCEWPDGVAIEFKGGNIVYRGWGEPAAPPSVLTGKPCEDCQGTGKALYDGERKRRTCTACEGTGDANRETDSQFTDAPQSSPLPWTVGPNPNGCVKGTEHLKSLWSTRMGGALQLTRVSDCVAENLDDADAALIVRRVNQGPAFDAMVEALEFTVSKLESRQRLQTLVQAEREILNRSRAALKLAQEIK